MDDDDRAARCEVSDAAEVFAARREVSRAVADLAASPLDVAAADQMRQVLDSPGLKKALRALARLQRPRTPHLSAVKELSPVDEEDRPRRASSPFEGSAA